MSNKQTRVPKGTTTRARGSVCVLDAMGWGWHVSGRALWDHLGTDSAVPQLLTGKPWLWTLVLSSLNVELIITCREIVRNKWSEEWIMKLKVCWLYGSYVLCYYYTLKQHSGHCDFTRKSHLVHNKNEWRGLSHLFERAVSLCLFPVAWFLVYIFIWDPEDPLASFL